MKQEVEVETEGGIVKAIVYVMAKEYEGKPAEPSIYYLDTIWKGYIDNKIPIKSLKEAVAENSKEVMEIEKKRFDFRGFYQ